MSKGLFIPEPKMPTPEEHRQVSLKWLERVQPVLIDQWPEDILALSFQTEFVRVPNEVWGEICDVMDGKPFGKCLIAMSEEIDAKLGWDRKFIRLNSRSPKDAPWPFKVPATVSGKEALFILTGSMRVVDDLYEFHWVPEQPAFVCLRDFAYGLTPSDEYRCFVKGGNLIAVSAYDYTKPVRPLPNEGKEVREAIDAYFTGTLKPRLHIQDVVFDLWMPRGRNPVLIELNPYGLSDPCFFRSYANVESAASHVQTVEVEQ